MEDSLIETSNEYKSETSFFYTHIVLIELISKLYIFLLCHAGSFHSTLMYMWNALIRRKLYDKT